MSEREVCFCCLQEMSDEERRVLPCCGKARCATCAEDESMKEFFETRGCPLCRRTDFVVLTLLHHLDDPGTIVLKKDGNVETYVLSDRCARYLQRMFVVSIHRGIALLVNEGVVDGNDSTERLPRTARAAEKIHEMMLEYAAECRSSACEYLAHATKRYSRDEVPPILRLFVAHTMDTPAWNDVPMHFREVTCQVFNFDDLVSKARTITEETGRRDVTVADVFRYARANS